MSKLTKEEIDAKVARIDGFLRSIISVTNDSLYCGDDGDYLDVWSENLDLIKGDIAHVEKILSELMADKEQES